MACFCKQRRGRRRGTIACRGGREDNGGYMMPPRSRHVCYWAMLGSRWCIGHKCVEGGSAGRGRSCNMVRCSIAEKGERQG